MNNQEKRQWIEPRIGKQCLLKWGDGGINEYKLVNIAKAADMVKIRYHVETSQPFWVELRMIEIVEELD